MASNVSDEALPPELLDSVQEFNSLIDEVDNVLNQLIDNEFASQVDKVSLLCN